MSLGPATSVHPNPTTPVNADLGVAELPANLDGAGLVNDHDDSLTTQGPRAEVNVAALGNEGLTAAGRLAQAQGSGAAEGVEVANSYQSWISRFNREWDSRVGSLKGRFNDPQISAQLDRLRNQIGPEWAKPSGVGTITTSDVMGWANQLRGAQTAAQARPILRQISSEVAARLAQARART